MVAGYIALLGAAAFLVFAIYRGRQASLMAAVLTYMLVVCWIIQRDLSMLMPALGIAIVLGGAGLGAVIYREILSHDDTFRHPSFKTNTNSSSIEGNIGS
ncbi:MAG TPA: hypothetical protein VK196_16820 [Magnetospirillum sp.]|nr:hypothetical protein [Magnetospirillum sp.]